MAAGANKRRSRMTPSQARASRRTRRARRKRFIRIGLFTVVGVVAFFLIISLFAGSLPISIGGGAPSGPGIQMRDQGDDHVAPGQDHPLYNSVPATSGWHYAQPLAPARWGVHNDVLEDEVLLHNLEHGGIGVNYDCPEGCDELVAELTKVVERAVDRGGKVIMSPYSGLESKIALTAWTFLDGLQEFDEERIDAFIKSHESSSNAPEPRAR